VPSLAPPFAVVGFAAGWLAVGVLANPLVYRSYGVNRPVAALLSAVVGAAVGAWLSASPARTDSELKGEAPWRLAVPVLAGGAMVGLTVALLAEGWDYGGEAILFGIASGLAFLPACRAVVRSARRSARARMGSLVARADRRAVWSMLAVCVGLATLAATIDWPAARLSGLAPPWVSLGLAVGALVVALAVRIADARALRRVAELATQSEQMEACDPSAMSARQARVEVDLGLGDEARARIDHGVAGYRGRDRASELVVGSPALAREALASVMQRGTRACFVLGLVVVAHGLATLDSAAYLFHLRRCDDLSAVSCAAAAEVAPSITEVEALRRRACHGSHWESCEWLAAHSRRATTRAR
jgi:hypothetical protein